MIVSQVIRIPTSIFYWHRYWQSTFLRMLDAYHRIFLHFVGVFIAIDTAGFIALSFAKPSIFLLSHCPSVARSAYGSEATEVLWLQWLLTSNVLARLGEFLMTVGTVRWSKIILAVDSWSAECKADHYSTRRMYHQEHNSVLSFTA